MPENFIHVCVHLEPGAERGPIEQTVLRSGGVLSPRVHRTRFWASTHLTLRQVRNIAGVKDCTLAPR